MSQPAHYHEVALAEARDCIMLLVLTQADKSKLKKLAATFSA